MHPTFNHVHRCTLAALAADAVMAQNAGVDAGCVPQMTYLQQRVYRGQEVNRPVPAARPECDAQESEGRKCRSGGMKTTSDMPMP